MDVSHLLDELNEAQREAVSAAKTPYVRFDLTAYAVPHRCAREFVLVLADLGRRRLDDGAAACARFGRWLSQRSAQCWSTGMGCVASQPGTGSRDRVESLAGLGWCGPGP